MSLANVRIDKEIRHDRSTPAQIFPKDLGRHPFRIEVSATFYVSALFTRANKKAPFTFQILLLSLLGKIRNEEAENIGSHTVVALNTSNTSAGPRRAKSRGRRGLIQTPSQTPPSSVFAHQTLSADLRRQAPPNPAEFLSRHAVRIFQ